MIQSKDELEDWYNSKDPWHYENNAEDIKRKKVLLSEIPDRNFNSILDIGCGNGFVTHDLPGNHVLGVDISENAVKQANDRNKNPNVSFITKNIFDIVQLQQTFDLIIITGVLYPQYIGRSSNLIYTLIDQILEKEGILISVHINDWYTSRFPYNLFREYMYPYKEYLHRLEVYQK